MPLHHRLAQFLGPHGYTCASILLPKVLPADLRPDPSRPRGNPERGRCLSAPSPGETRRRCVQAREPRPGCSPWRSAQGAQFWDYRQITSQTPSEKFSLSWEAAVRRTRLRDAVTGDRACSWEGPQVPL